MWLTVIITLVSLINSYSGQLTNVIECGSSKSMAYQSSDCSKSNRIVNRIVGGRSASIEELPWMASLYVTNLGYCGAVIIERKWLLTAAHCLPKQRDIKLNEVFVRTGSTDKLMGELNPVQNVVIQPKYDINGYIPNDIALIQLKNAIKLSTSSANRVCTPHTNDSMDRPELTVFAGWGQTGIEGNKPTNTLKKAFYYTIPSDQCTGFTSKEFVCVNTSQEMGCAGDSGSPLIKYNGCQAVLLGIFSYSKRHDIKSRCGPGFMIFVRISQKIKWIESITGKLITGQSITAQSVTGQSVTDQTFTAQSFTVQSITGDLPKTKPLDISLETTFETTRSIGTAYLQNNSNIYSIILVLFIHLFRFLSK